MVVRINLSIRTIHRIPLQAPMATKPGYNSVDWLRWNRTQNGYWN